MPASETVKAAAAGWLPGVVDRDYVASGLHRPAPAAHPEARPEDRQLDLSDGEAVETGERARVQDPKAFALAGRAVFTILNTKTGGRFTYKVSKSEDGRVWFVGVLTGSDNTRDYSYAGIVKDGAFFQTRKSRLSATAPSVVAFKWFWARLAGGVALPTFVEVWHEGACCRCGRRLTTPESVKAGIGPVCSGRE